MLIEGSILTGDESINHVLGEPGEADNLSVLVGGKLSDELAVYVQETGGKGCGKFGKTFRIDNVSGFC